MEIMTDKLKQIGFYTLCDDRARNASDTSPMWRCELIITDRCNFKCPYCRDINEDPKGDISLIDASAVIKSWAAQDLKHIRLSGGEPTLHPHLKSMVECAKREGIERIAISTNGSDIADRYIELYRAGVNDFSISLDACCASTGDSMAGVSGHFNKVTSNIRLLSRMTYVTVGVVFTDENVDDVIETIHFAHDLGVADIRIILAAQCNNLYFEFVDALISLDEEILKAHPILRYRVNNILEDVPFRGLKHPDSHRCGLLHDDCMVAGGYHYPCIIYFREGGKPIGKTDINMRKDRVRWAQTHDTHDDPICRANCLDVCVDYNNRFEQLKKEESKEQ